MVDPTGIVGVIEVAGQVLEYTSKFDSSWTDAKEEAKSFIFEVGALRTTLLRVHNLLSDPKFANALEKDSSALLSELDPLHDTDTTVLLSICKDELQSLLTKLKKRTDGHRFGWECLKAALDGGKACEAVENLHRRYQALNLLFWNDQLALQTKVLQQPIGIRDDLHQNHGTQVRQLQSIEQRTNAVASGVLSIIQKAHTAEALQKHGEILDWLSSLASVDYSLQQADFFRQRQEGTGQWFLESPQFQEWYFPCSILSHGCCSPS
jgi:hypothetical protein